MSAPTKGPYKVEPAISGFRAPNEDGAKDMMLVAPDGCCPAIVWELGEEGLANAHLLAASWEMREALAYAIDNPEFDPETFERMTRAALAKAQGERHEG